MERRIIRRHFESIGARVRFRTLDRERGRSWGREPESLLIDIKHDEEGAIFDIARSRHTGPVLDVLQTRPKERHLLLYSRDGERFLCGHDERDWFVAVVPKRVSTVRDAKQALMPAEVWKEARKLPPGATSNRRNSVFVRQGEWFFVPVDRDIPEQLILKNEPLQRTPGSKPHVCEELYRENGELVYLVGGRAYTEEEYRERKLADKRFGRRRGVQTRVRNPHIYARGYVRHADHSTVHLKGWHRVHINAELSFEQTRSIGFLD